MFDDLAHEWFVDGEIGFLDFVVFLTDFGREMTDVFVTPGADGFTRAAHAVVETVATRAHGHGEDGDYVGAELLEKIVGREKRLIGVDLL